MACKSWLPRSNTTYLENVQCIFARSKTLTLAPVNCIQKIVVCLDAECRVFVPKDELGPAQKKACEHPTPMGAHSAIETSTPRPTQSRQGLTLRLQHRIGASEDGTAEELECLSSMLTGTQNTLSNTYFLSPCDVEFN